MRLRVKRWLEVRGLLALLLLQVVLSVSASLAASAHYTLGALDRWSTRITLLILLSAFTIAVGIESGRCMHKDLAITATALAVASQLLYTLVILD